jgi:hypothetical protein
MSTAKTRRNLWKRSEQKVATFFHTKRNPLSGSMSGHSSSDSLDKYFYIETKRRKKHRVMGLLRGVREAAEMNEQLALVCLTEEGQKGFGILVHSEDLIWLALEFLKREGYTWRRKT